MRQIKFRSDKLPQLVLGTAQLGQKYGVANTSKTLCFTNARALVHTALRKGVRVIDTAFAYGNAQDKVFKSTQNTSALVVSKVSKKELMVQNNAHKLNKKKLLFALLLHTHNTLITQAVREKVQQLKQNKSIKYFGISIYEDSEFQRAVGCKEVDIIEVPFNLFDQRLIALDWVKQAKKYNKLLLIRSVFLQGLFFLDTNNLPSYLEQTKTSLKALHTLCEKYKLDIASLAMAFASLHANKHLIIVGCDNKEQLCKNISTFACDLFLPSSMNSEIVQHFATLSPSIYDPRKWHSPNA